MDAQQRIKARGSREEVWAGQARRTSGGLTKDDIIMNARGKLVSKKQSDSAKERYPALKAKLCGTPAQELQACECKAEPVPEPAAQALPVPAPAAPAAAPAPREAFIPVLRGTEHLAPEMRAAWALISRLFDHTPDSVNLLPRAAKTRAARRLQAARALLPYYADRYDMTPAESYHYLLNEEPGAVDRHVAQKWGN